MKEPIEPSKEDCCSSGCNPCIFDVYQKQLTLFKKYIDNGDDSQSHSENGISQLQYIKFIVTKNLQVCEAHHLLIFKSKNTKMKHTVQWTPGEHFLVKYTNGDYTCSRAYTPMKYKLQNDADFSVIVKKYHNGVVSQYLCDLEPGQETLWRGPYGSFINTTNKFHRLIMIAQGTGIAPFISIIESILNNEDDMTKIILHYCCPKEETILFREDLYSWKGYWNFTYTVYLSHSNKNNVYKYQEPVVNNRLDTDKLMIFKPFTAKDQILLSGSDQFMKYYQLFLKMQEAVNVTLF